MRRKCDLGDFDHGVFAGARLVEVFLETTDLMGFQGFTRKGNNNNNLPWAPSSSIDGHAVDEGGLSIMVGLVWADRKDMLLK